MMDNNEIMLRHFLAEIIRRLGGTTQEIVTVTSRQVITPRYLRRVDDLIGKYRGHTVETGMIMSWRDTLPDDMILGALEDWLNVIRLSIPQYTHAEREKLHENYVNGQK
jgi:hypothetical protein